MQTNTLKIDKTIRDTVSLFELNTIFTMEYTEYRALYSINVNNYLAVKPDGKVKRTEVY